MASSCRSIVAASTKGSRRSRRATRAATFAWSMSAHAAVEGVDRCIGSQEANGANDKRRWHPDPEQFGLEPVQTTLAEIGKPQRRRGDGPERKQVTQRGEWRGERHTPPPAREGVQHAVGPCQEEGGPATNV